MGGDSSPKYYYLYQPQSEPPLFSKKLVVRLRATQHWESDFLKETNKNFNGGKQTLVKPHSPLPPLTKRCWALLGLNQCLPSDTSPFHCTGRMHPAGQRKPQTKGTHSLMGTDFCQSKVRFKEIYLVRPSWLKEGP